MHGHYRRAKQGAVPAFAETCNGRLCLLEHNEHKLLGYPYHVVRLVQGNNNNVVREWSRLVNN